MAKASWLTVDPMSGSGNDTLNNTALEHTGREARETTVTGTAIGVSSPDTYVVEQEGKAEFIQFDNGAEMSAPKNGGQISVTGKSNSAKLSFSEVGGSSLEIGANYTAGGKSTANGEAIAGDPGADAQYNFSVNVTLPENPTTEERTFTLQVNNGGSVSQQIVIKQAAGEAYFRFSKDKITIPQAGGSASVEVESNTTWTIS